MPRIVKSGQVWADADPRAAGRTVRIESTDDRFAYCVVVTSRRRSLTDSTGRKTRIDHQGYYGLHGYELVPDA